jgi:hypothetical protein
MLFLQSLPFFTQPWGGATAARAAEFKRLDVAGLWRRTVVDDSSLAGLLRRQGISVLFCPDALLESGVRSMTRNALDEWLFRQLFYPRVYTFGAWLLIGFCLVWFAAACAACPYILFLALRGAVPFTVLAAALLVPCAQMLLQELLRRRVAADCPKRAWLKGLALAATALYGNYARTIAGRSMVWRGIRYVLGADGRVLRVERTGKAAGSPSGRQAA